MKRCPGCQTEQPDDAQVCSWCGRDMQEVVSTPAVVPAASESRGRTIAAVGGGFAMTVLLVPVLAFAVVLLLLDATAGLVLIAACVVVVALKVALPFVTTSSRWDAAVCAVVVVASLGVAVWLASTDRPGAWFECLIAIVCAALYLVRGWRKLRV